MKLEFDRSAAPESVTAELGFDEFLELFDTDMPLLPVKTVRFCEPESGRRRYADLEKLEQRLDRAGPPVERLVSKSRGLPKIDEILPFLTNRTLEQYHLHLLGRFVREDQRLREFEGPGAPLDCSGESCDTILNLLSQHMTENFSGLKSDPETDALRREIETLDRKTADALTAFEQDIYSRTGLKMTYPYPREIMPDDPALSIAEACDLLTCAYRNEIVRIGYNPPDAIRNLIARKQKLESRISGIMETRLQRVNMELSACAEGFINYYKKRKTRVYRYVLLDVKKRNGFCFPKFTDAAVCEFRGAELPVLKKNAKHYIPLDIRLEQGANVIFGANMTGKTTVLKTLYFHLTAVGMGLPLPAAAVALRYPKHVRIHLKTSGDIQTGLSGLGTELAFFENAFEPFSYVLADELFQSTNPVGGAALAGLVVEEYGRTDALFCCTCHYPQVLDIKSAALFRMREGEGGGRRFLENRPYRVERIRGDCEDDKIDALVSPLRIALQYALPDSLKQRIEHYRERMGHGKDTSE